MPTIPQWQQKAQAARQAGDNEYADQVEAYVKELSRLPEYGAPPGLRAQLSALDQTQQGQLLSQQYGDASQDPEGNWTVPDGRGGYTRVNPAGIDRGDFAEHGRIGAELVGGGLGALAGGTVSSPTVMGMPAGVLAGGAVGAQVGGEAYDAALRQSVGMPDTRTPGQVAIEVGTGLAIDFLAPGVLDQLAKGGKGFLRRFLASDSAGAVEGAAKRQDVTTTAAMHGNERVQKWEGALESAHIGGPAKRRAVVADDIERALNKSLEPHGTLSSPQQMGQYLVGVADHYVDNFNAAARKLYNDVDALIPHTTRMDTNSLQQFIRNKVERYADDPDLAELVETPVFKRLKTLLGKEDASYGALAALRSDIGKALHSDQHKLLTDSSRGELKQIYTALSNDLLAGADTVSKEAGAAYRAANAHYSAGAGVIQDVLEPLIGRTGRDEDVYLRLLSQSKRGGSTLQNLVAKGVLNQSDIDHLAAGTLRHFSQPNPGAVGVDANAFSPASFATKYNRLSPEVQELLFGTSTIAPDVDDLMKLSGAWKDAGIDINRSRTAGAANMLDLTGGMGSAFFAGGDQMGAALGTAAATLAGPGIANKLLQSGAIHRAMVGAHNPSIAKREIMGLLAANGIQGPAAERMAEELMSQQLQPTPVPQQQQAPTLNPAQAQPQGMLQPAPYMMNPQSAVDPMALPQRNAPGRETRQLPAHVPQLAEWGMDPVNFLV